MDDIVAMARAAQKDDRLADGALYGKLADEIEWLRAVLEAINADIKPELCASELELIAWWGRQVDQLQAIAAAALTNGDGK